MRFVAIKFGYIEDIFMLTLDFIINYNKNSEAL